RLVAPADAIDEALALRLGGEPRPAAEEALGRFGREAARGGDVAGDLAVERPEKALELLLVRFREAALDEVVEGGLVFLAPLEARLDPDLLERVAQERIFAAQPREPDRAARLKPDLVESGREIVGPQPRAQLAEAVGEGDRGLAARAEGLDRGAQLLRRAEAVGVVAETREDADDAGIGGGALQPVEDVAQRGRGLEYQRLE